MKETCWVEISLDALRHNVSVAKTTLAVRSQLMVAVKSDAYGHGGARVAKEVIEAEADALAVLDIPTGVAIRQVLADTPLLCWLLSPSDDFSKGVAAALDFGISAQWQLDKIEACYAGEPVNVHLKIDTGLHRNGSLASNWPELVQQARRLEIAGVMRVVGIWSHLADTSLEEDRVALSRFHAAVKIATEAGLNPTVLHVAASSAAADLPESRLDMVRIGIILYGVSPFEERTAQEMGFEAVMKACAEITEVDAEAGQATLGIGFADGLLPLPPQHGYVVIDSDRWDIVRIEVDHTVLQIPSGLSASLGQTAILWGDPASGSPCAEDWAGWAGTIGDEVVASVAPHVPRLYV
jgi:alanine racemase